MPNLAPRTSLRSLEAVRNSRSMEANLHSSGSRMSRLPQSPTGRYPAPPASSPSSTNHHHSTSLLQTRPRTSRGNLFWGFLVSYLYTVLMKGFGHSHHFDVSDSSRHYYIPESPSVLIPQTCVRSCLNTSKVFLFCHPIYVSIYPLESL